jgi:hypothetical protein
MVETRHLGALASRRNNDAPSSDRYVCIHNRYLWHLCLDTYYMGNTPMTQYRVGYQGSYLTRIRSRVSMSLISDSWCEDFDDELQTLIESVRGGQTLQTWPNGNYAIKE